MLPLLLGNSVGSTSLGSVCCVWWVEVPSSSKELGCVGRTKGLVEQKNVSKPSFLPPFFQPSFRKVAGVRSTAPKDAVRRVLDEKKCGKEKLCQELEELRAARKR